MSVNTYLSDMVGTIIRVLLEIYFSFQQWKNFENSLRIDKVIAMSLMYYCFLGHVRVNCEIEVTDDERRWQMSMQHQHSCGKRARRQVQLLVGRPAALARHQSGRLAVLSASKYTVNSAIHRKDDGAEQRPITPLEGRAPIVALCCRQYIFYVGHFVAQ